MANTISGRCVCGRITYEYSGVVGPANYCHCEDCRRSTGSAFNIGVRFDTSEFHIRSGAPRGFAKFGESGRELTRHFCADCGSPIFTSSPDHPDYVFVKAGTLDDSTIIRPTHQSWTRSAVPWSRIDDDLPDFGKGRDSGVA